MEIDEFSRRAASSHSSLPYCYKRFLGQGTTHVVDYYLGSRFKRCNCIFKVFVFDKPSIERLNYISDFYSCLCSRPVSSHIRHQSEHVGQLGIHPQNLAAKAYGSGEFLAWLLARNIQPHIPVIDRRHQTQGHFTREHFRYEPKENAYYCPEGKALRYRGQSRGSRGNVYRSTEAQCLGCPQKKLCTPGPNRKLFVHWEEPARQTVRELASTPAYKRSQRERYKIEALFAELKQQIKLRKVRLRRLWNVAEQFYLAATAQNLKRLVRHLAQNQSPRLSTT